MKMLLLQNWLIVKVENKVSKMKKDCCSEQKLKRQRKTGNKIIPIEKSAVFNPKSLVNMPLLAILQSAGYLFN